MTDLPASIESALEEAGFTGTEILLIKKLLQEDALTVRELAAKTGKSTGVLDQAVKKLLKKGILSRDMINGAPKYALRSLEVVLKWMEEDTKMKQEMMVRRQQNFETFIRSIVVSQTEHRRPEMEYFEGVDGVKKAYMQLLHCGNDIAQYGPTLYLAEEDPLREFKVQWFRERQKRGIFSRVITHDTVLGRRFRSRDPFEYRKSILVDPNAYPFNFERIIIGDMIACFETSGERACFIRYPEFAENERMFFDRLWNKKVQQSTQQPDVDTQGRPVPPPDVITVPFKTKTLSSMREFLVGRRSLAVLALFSIFSIMFTYGVYLRDEALNMKRVQERALSIAATGALQFHPEDIDELRSLRDVQKPQYAKVVYQLNLIRNQNSGVKYAYIMRPTENPTLLQFVADADSINPYQIGDLNKDGIVDSADDLPVPGEVFDISMYDSLKKVFISKQPEVDAQPETDKWGTFISGVGPIKDASGNVIAIFGVDVDASMVQDLSKNSMMFFGIFLFLFFALVIIRLMAFNRSLLKEMMEVCMQRKRLMFLILGGCLSIILSVSWYVYDVTHTIQKARQSVETIAVNAALQFSAAEVNTLRTIKDIDTPIYKDVVRKLHDILQSDSQILYAYLIRPKKNTTLFEFIADADANGKDILKENIINNPQKDNVINEIGYPGLPYTVDYIDALTNSTYYTPTSTKIPYSDKWGTVISGYAPIFDDSEAVVALLAIDTNAEGFYLPSAYVFLPFLIFVPLVIIYLMVLNRLPINKLIEFFRKK